MFDSILGHSRPARVLERLLTTSRLAHAYLFSGPDGVGKGTMAREMAAALLCTDHSSTEPCGRCPGCLQFSSGNHPDFLHIVPDGVSIRIDRIRELKKQLAFSPFAGGKRVILIEEAQSMRREAGNSLLKLLEEPPPDNLFFLVGSDAEPILPTILSRCQVISFGPLSREDAAEVIARQKPEASRDECVLLAELSGGCPGRALALESGELLSLRRRIIDAVSGRESSAARRVESALLAARDMAELKEGLELLFDLLRIYLKDRMRDVLLQGHTVEGGSGQAKEGEQARELWNLSRLSDKMAAVDSAAEALARNCNRGLVCEVLMLKLCS